MKTYFHSISKKAQKLISEDKMFKAIEVIKNFPSIGKIYMIDLIALENRLNMLNASHHGNLMQEDVFLVNKAKICHSMLHLVHRIEMNHSTDGHYQTKKRSRYPYIMIAILFCFSIAIGIWWKTSKSKNLACYESFYKKGEFKKAYECYESIAKDRNLSLTENVQKENCRFILLGNKYFLQMLWINAELSYKGVKDKNLEKYFIHRLHYIFELQKKSVINATPNKDTSIKIDPSS